MAANKNTPNSKPVHPIGAAIDTFDHSVRDIEACARLFIPIACDIVVKSSEEALQDLDTLIKSVETGPREKQPAAHAQLDATFSRLGRLEKTRIPFRLNECLFVGLFSVYDAFLGNLLGQIFKKKPALYECIKGEIKTGEILKYDSLDQLRARIVDDYIDDIRRKSYVDQFSQLESIFSIPLKKFPNWPRFVEAAQRRNLLTHCDGVVSEQYLKSCAEVGYKFPKDKTPAIGEKLELTPAYFMETCLVIQEVGIKLAHTLWRKLFENELESADEYLSDLIYEHLKNGKLQAAVCLGEFAHSQKRFANEQWRLVIAVNYCIGLLQSNRKNECAEIINGFDLTTALPEFKLARAVLLGDFKEAATVMKLIGKEGQILTAMHYQVWPLFREFRGSREFQETYKKIYRHDFITEIKRVASQKKVSVDAIRAASTGNKAAKPVTKPKSSRANRKTSGPSGPALPSARSL